MKTCGNLRVASWQPDDRVGHTSPRPPLPVTYSQVTGYIFQQKGLTPPPPHPPLPVTYSQVTGYIFQQKGLTSLPFPYFKYFLLILDYRQQDHVKEVLCEDNTILWISKLCWCVSVRWCFIELV